MIRKMMAARSLRALCSDEMTTSRWSHGMAFKRISTRAWGPSSGSRVIDPVVAPSIDGKWTGDQNRLRNNLLLFVLHVRCGKLLCACPLDESVRRQCPGLHKQFELRAP